MDVFPSSIVQGLVNAAEAGRVPDALLRIGIRRIVATRLRDEQRIGRRAPEFADQLDKLPVAIATAEANEQHYEVPSAFFERVLGARLKYSCAWFGNGITALDVAEEAMLALTADRAGIEDGMSILELGCGWGSLTLWLAEHYPSSRIVAVSNSETQREFILQRAGERCLDNLEVIRADVAVLELEGPRFDRVVSVEMFEHMRNWPELYARIHGWLVPDGRFFQHVFCHREHPYFFEDDGETDWMARNFFSGGIMPSFDLPSAIQGPLDVVQSWEVGGEHYARTAEAWLARTDAQEGALHEIFVANGSSAPAIDIQRWRMFFMACAELFAYRGGREWFVGHYLLRPRTPKR